MARHPAYRERYEHTKKRLGRQRGSNVARVEIARELATAIWDWFTAGYKTGLPDRCDMFSGNP